MVQIHFSILYQIEYNAHMFEKPPGNSFNSGKLRKFGLPPYPTDFLRIPIFRVFFKLFAFSLHKALFRVLTEMRSSNLIRGIDVRACEWVRSIRCEFYVHRTTLKNNTY